jgi:flagellar motor switch protein FliN/FliY
MSDTATVPAGAPATADAANPAADNAQPAPAGVEVHEAVFPQTPPREVTGGLGQLDILLDTSMPVTVSLGQLEITIRDLLQLGQGAVLKLDKRVGEPVELFLRGIRFATGNLVVVGDQLGVRIKEILATPGGPSV